MADRIASSDRRSLMARVRQKHTTPELAVRRVLHAAGFRYVLHPKHLPGTPDLVLPKYRVAIFINGCFWHGHDCRAGRLPSTNVEFWRQKIDANRKRDSRKTEQLEAAGWRVIHVWECATKGTRLTIECTRLMALIRGSMAYKPLTR